MIHISRISKATLFGAVLAAAVSFVSGRVLAINIYGDGILSADDKFEIQELETRYYFSIDHNDLEAWVATFTKDGQFESPFGNATGTKALRTWIEGFHKQAIGNRHVWTNHLSEEDGAGVRSVSYFLVVDAKNQPAIIASGEYESELRREDGRWKFARRVLKLDPSVQVPEEM